MIKQGDVVLVPFIFTDLVGQKVRPAIVLSDGVVEGHVLLCFVTSKVSGRKGEYHVDIKKKDPGFSVTGLKVSSRIKLIKTTALDKKLVLAKLGELPKTKREEVIKVFKSLI